METLTFQGRGVGEMTLDVCFGCQGIWFDRHESTQLPPSGVLDLFRLIHSKGVATARPWNRALHCPRCATGLQSTIDLCKNGRFSYFHCPNQHGRFTAFTAFLIEKGFVRQLSHREIGELPAEVRTVRCSSCGAPVDIRKESVCPYCQAPVVVLDHQAVEKALAGLQASVAQKQTVDRMALVDALLVSERQKWLQDMQEKTGASRSWWHADGASPLSNGVDLLWGLLHR